MPVLRRHFLAAAVIILSTGFLPSSVSRAQDAAVVLTGGELQRVVPSGFYFSMLLRIGLV